VHLNEILQILEKENIKYLLEVSKTLDEQDDFFPASTKKLVEKGIYFIQIPAPSYEIKITRSVVFCTQSLGTHNHEIIVENPQLVHYVLTGYFQEKKQPIIHPTAQISADAKIGNRVNIGPYSIIGNCIIGDNVDIRSHVVIEDKVTIGDNSIIDSSTVIGAAGLAWIWDDHGNRIIQPQLGGVIIGNDCILGTDITVVRGSLSEDTVIGFYSVMAHGTKIGHGAQIGSHVHMANNVSIAGNAVIGDSSFLGSAAVVSSNIIIPNNTIIGAAAMVNKNFDEEYLTLAGVPATIIKRNNFESKPHGAPKPFKKSEK
jgi:UDP-3-O-[3-hydroxymyristoyl] glucosamine N-acyltransferase